MFRKKIINKITYFWALILNFYTSVTFGADQSIGDIANNITGTFANIAKLINAASYLAGFGLTVAALFKFKQHKENPQQVQLGTCVTLLIVGVCLIFLPSLITTGGQSIFGEAKQKGDVNGGNI